MSALASGNFVLAVLQLGSARLNMSDALFCIHVSLFTVWYLTLALLQLQGRLGAHRPLPRLRPGRRGEPIRTAACLGAAEDRRLLQRSVR